MVVSGKHKGKQSPYFSFISSKAYLEERLSQYAHIWLPLWELAEDTLRVLVQIHSQELCWVADMFWVALEGVPLFWVPMHFWGSSG